MFSIIAVLGISACQGEAGHEVLVVLDAAPDTLDPRLARADYGVKLSRLVFSSLMTVDTPDTSPEYDLIQDIAASSDTVYVITLREDVRFHDGHPLTSADVLYTIRSLEELRAPAAETFRDVTVEALGPYQVRFTLPHPRPTFLTADLCLPIVPAHLLEGREGTFGDDPPIGSGPFRYVSSSAGFEEVVLASNPDYYRGAPELERVTFRVMTDTNTRLLAALSGTADLVQNAIPQILLPCLSRYEFLSVETSTSVKYSYLIFNFRNEILADARVRQAIALALNRPEIIEQKLGGLAELSTGLLPPGHWAYSGDVSRWSYDPEQARALLDEAGYPMGAQGEPRFRLVLKISSDRFRRSIALLMVEQLREVGIEVELRAYEWATFFADVRSGSFELATLQFPSVTDPDWYYSIFHSSSIPTAENGGRGANRGAYVSAEMDALLERGRTEMDPTERRSVYAAVQELAALDLPMVSLWHEQNVVVRNRRLEGYRPTANARFRFLAEARLALDPAAEPP